MNADTDTATTPALWACDNLTCGYVGTEAQADAHWAANNMANGRLIETGTPHSWGTVQVGSDTWQQMVFDGVHPMTAVMGLVVQVVDAYPELWGDLA